ncbi:hypothetical protein ACTI_71270 [Actinoplanes sp. OR16]|uniref:DUF1707 and DUF4190 domain-containing protein n=1 Tax=Actinoplanes sp. OR16 TaxID=946334 RepID=UPI000F6D32AF|nr:DUF1707 and DUF4190 domain-containing protein [Actinoplanes sp. OR16]BBH70442.1 hypothetical protein ACTI_71270 [Actinoplanes sp. OR16]
MYREPHMRVSDADRETIVARLNQATAEGRLSIEEFSERTRQAYACRTWGELSRVVWDLPAHTGTHPVVYGRTAPPPPPSPNGGAPLVALVLGVLSLPATFCVPVGPFLSIGAIISGVIGLRSPVNRGMAVAGIGLGALGLIFQIVFILFFAFSSDDF